MTVSLRGTAAPIRDVSKLGYAAVAIYSLLFESASKEHEFHRPANGRPYVTGGTTHWSHKAISQTLHMGKATMLKSIDKLLDAGFITVIGYLPSQTGSPCRIYRVIHPQYIESQCHALEVIGMPASVRQRLRDASARETISDRDQGRFDILFETDEAMNELQRINFQQLMQSTRNRMLIMS